MKKPKLFKPSVEDQKRIASIISNNLSTNKAIQISNGESVRGTKPMFHVKSKK